MSDQVSDLTEDVLRRRAWITEHAVKSNYCPECVGTVSSDATVRTFCHLPGCSVPQFAAWEDGGMSEEPTTRARVARDLMETETSRYLEALRKERVSDEDVRAAISKCRTGDAGCPIKTHKMARDLLDARALSEARRQWIEAHQLADVGPWVECVQCQGCFVMQEEDSATPLEHAPDCSVPRLIRRMGE
jgi:hypothetical protein